MGVFAGGDVFYQTPTFVAVAVTSTELVAANLLRKQVLFVNDSDTPIYLGFDGDAAVVGSGSRLNANGGSIQVGGKAGLELDTAQINAIHGGTGTKNMTVQEAI